MTVRELIDYLLDKDMSANVEFLDSSLTFHGITNSMLVKENTVLLTGTDSNYRTDIETIFKYKSEGKEIPNVVVFRNGKRFSKFSFECLQNGNYLLTFNVNNQIEYTPNGTRADKPGGWDIIGFCNC